MIIERAKSASISDFSRFIDDVNPFGPTSVREIRRIVHVVHAQRKREVEPPCEIVGNRHALRQCLRLGIANTLVHVGFHLPFVLRVRLANINRQKLGAVFVIVVEVYEVAYLAAERWSGVASENENERLLSDSIAEVEYGLPVERQQWHVRCAVSHVQIAAMPLRQRVTKKPVNIARPAHQIA